MSEVNTFQSKACIDLSKSNDRAEDFLNLRDAGESHPYHYQIKAYEKLNSFLNDASRTAGLLVLPTGAGKTRVATTWLLHSAVRNGYKVLWIAHRHMLISQAFQSFIKFATLAHQPKTKEKLHVMLAAGNKYEDLSSLNPKHGTNKDADVVIVTNQSAYYPRGMRALKDNFLNRVEKLIVVVDEAHHSTGSSYKKWIGNQGYIKQRLEKNIKHLKILGLTATPTNMIEDKAKELSEIFENSDPIYSISVKELIKNGILSKPEFHEVKTNIKFDVSELDVKSYSVPIIEEKLNEKIAESGPRNKIIVETYKNGIKNGNKHIVISDAPTLIFVASQAHAVTLHDEFENQGISSNYVIHSQGQERNQLIIDEFKSGKFSVLINLNILTEGSDIPSIKNVFIARITQSETLLTQMVGRALRGPRAGGTAIANIVSFHDDVSDGADPYKILNPKEMLYGEYQEAPEKKQKKAESTFFSVAEIQEIYHQYKKVLTEFGSQATYMSAVPIGYYELLDCPLGDSTDDAHIMVFEFQKDRYDAFSRYIDTDKPSKLDPDKIYEKFFTNNPHCMISFDKDEIDLLCRYIEINGELPEFIRYSERIKAIDTMDWLATMVRERGMKEDEIDHEFMRSENGLYSFFRGDEDRFNEELNRVKNQQRKIARKYKNTGEFHDSSMNIVYLEPEETTITLDENAHDLEVLRSNAEKIVMKEMKRKKLKNPPEEVKWTDKVYKTYYGIAYGFDWMRGLATGNDRIIKINKILQSRETPEKVIEFVLYHELLHLELQQGHTKKFRDLEMKHPYYNEAKSYMDRIKSCIQEGSVPGLSC